MLGGSVKKLVRHRKGEIKRSILFAQFIYVCKGFTLDYFPMAMVTSRRHQTSCMRCTRITDIGELNAWKQGRMKDEDPHKTLELVTINCCTKFMYKRIKTRQIGYLFHSRNKRTSVLTLVSDAPNCTCSCSHSQAIM